MIAVMSMGLAACATSGADSVGADAMGRTIPERISDKSIELTARRNLATIATTIARYEPVSMLVREEDYAIAEKLLGTSNVKLVVAPLGRDHGTVHRLRAARARQELRPQGPGDLARSSGGGGQCRRPGQSGASLSGSDRRDCVRQGRMGRGRAGTGRGRLVSGAAARR